MSMVLWVSAALSGLLLLLSLIGIVCIWGTFYFFWGGLSLIWLLITLFRIHKKHTIKEPVIYLAGRILLAYIFFYFLQFETPVAGGFKAQYPMQIAYADKLGYNVSGFPEVLPKEVSNYFIEVVPSMLQGGGWVKLSFQTDDSTIEHYKETYASRTIWTKTMLQCQEEGFTILPPPSDYFEENPTDSIVYFISDDKTSDYSLTVFIIINDTANMIEFLVL